MTAKEREALQEQIDLLTVYEDRARELFIRLQDLNEKRDYGYLKGGV